MAQGIAKDCFGRGHGVFFLQIKLPGIFLELVSNIVQAPSDTGQLFLDQSQAKIYCPD